MVSGSSGCAPMMRAFLLLFLGFEPNSPAEFLELEFPNAEFKELGPPEAALRMDGSERAAAEAATPADALIQFLLETFFILYVLNGEGFAFTLCYDYGTASVSV